MMERRRFPRIEHECPVQMRAVNNDEHNLLRNSFCRNISTVGVTVISFDFYPVNGKVYLELLSRTCAKLFAIIGRIVWVQQIPFQNKYKIGIEFMGTSVDSERKIKAIMAPSNTDGERNNSYED